MRRVIANQVCVYSRPTKKAIVGFFNGVFNTENEARIGLDILRSEFGDTRNGNLLAHKLFYNQSACPTGKVACLQDIFETFSQRDRELGGSLAQRWEFFWESLTPSHRDAGSHTSTVLSAFVGTNANLLQLLDATVNAMWARIIALTADILANPPTASDSFFQISSLQTLADQGFGFTLVGHSQGNLFVNLAYDGIRLTRPNAHISVAHVAPASPTLRGDYALADIDLVIKGLRTAGGSGSVQSSNISIPISSSDWTGHFFVETYMDPSRAAYTKVKNMISAAIDSL